MKLSVVTICYNDREGLSKTMESVYNLNYMDYEYIVVDGASTDGSKDIALTYIKKFKDQGIKFSLISEPDSGIYNAMNKGIKLGSGDYYIFLNSGDGFYNRNVMKIFDEYLDKNIDVIYGNRFRIMNEGKIVNEINKPREYFGIRTGLTFCHQASFIKGDVMRQYLYDEKYRLGGDCKLFAKLYHDNKTFHYIDDVVCFYRGDGVSSQLIKLSYKETLMIDADINNNGNFSFKYKIKYLLSSLKNKFLKIGKINNK